MYVIAQNTEIMFSESILYPCLSQTINRKTTSAFYRL